MSQATFVEKWGGALKYWGNWGFAGLVCGYFLMIELPAMRKDGVVREDKQYEREEKARSAAISHGDTAIKVVGDKLEELTKAVDRQTSTIIEVQTTTHKNQERMIQQRDEKTKDSN